MTAIAQRLKPAEPVEQNPGKPSKKHVLPVILLATGILLAFFAVYTPEGQSDAEYLEQLRERKENGEVLPSGEEKDFCVLMAVLKDSISLACLPHLEGINWHRPPKTPDKLGDDWMEITDSRESFNGNRRVFQHKKYAKIRIAFDKANPDAKYKGRKAFAFKDHWQRINPNQTSKKVDYYLDKNGTPVYDGHKDSHITP